MKYLVAFSRLFVGSLFIVSGLIKANDPLGFSYKLEEYFAETALNLMFLEPAVLLLAVLACVAEIVLGFALLFGARMKLATWSLLILTLFFGWLTAYTATCDPNATFMSFVDGQEIERNVTCVTDCGCFGDAMKGSVGRSLTPWESFSKDMVLLVFLIPIFFKRGSIKLNTFQEDKIYLGLSLVFIAFFSWVFTWWFPVIYAVIGFLGYLAIKQLISSSKYLDWIMAAWITIMAFGFSHYTYHNLPIRDYRPYAEGKNISEGMKSAEELGLQPPVYGYIYSMNNESTGETVEISDKEYIADKWWEKEGWVMDEDNTEQVKIQDGYEAPIHDFLIMDEDGADVTDQILNEQKIFLLVSYNLNKTDEEVQSKVNEISKYCAENKIPFIGVTASTDEEVNNFRHKHQNMFPYYSSDGIVLKTIIRSNPGLVILEKGTVKNKFHHNNFPDASELNSL